MTVGERIKSLRISLSITQEELATAVKTKKQTIYKYETGIISNIPASKIKLIADHLNTTPAYLMGWEDESKLEEHKKLDDEFAKILSTMTDKDKEWLLGVLKSVIEGRK